jgi:hypothetical protein
MRTIVICGVVLAIFNSNLTSAPAPAKPILDDEEYLKQVYVSLRGTPPTAIETHFFVADRDEKKRSKIVEWLLEERRPMPTVVSTRINNMQKCLQLIETDRIITDKSGPLSGPEIDKVFTDLVGRRPLDRAVLLREIYLDLTGSAPTAATTQEFIDAKSPDVWNVLIRRLMGDDAFIQQVCIEARRSPPTFTELKYFKADTSAKKSENVLDLLRKDPALTKKLDDNWKRKMLAMADSKNASGILQSQLDLANSKYKVIAEDCEKEHQLWEQADELLRQKSSGEQIFEALAKKALGRPPTAGERQLALASVTGQQNKVVAWHMIAMDLMDKRKMQRWVAKASPRGESKEKFDKK